MVAARARTCGAARPPRGSGLYWWSLNELLPAPVAPSEAVAMTPIPITPGGPTGFQDADDAPSPSVGGACGVSPELVSSLIWAFSTGWPSRVTRISTLWVSPATSEGRGLTSMLRTEPDGRP